MRNAFHYNFLLITDEVGRPIFATSIKVSGYCFFYILKDTLRRNVYHALTFNVVNKTKPIQNASHFHPQILFLVLINIHEDFTPKDLILHLLLSLNMSEAWPELYFMFSCITKAIRWKVKKYKMSVVDVVMRFLSLFSFFFFFLSS